VLGQCTEALEEQLKSHEDFPTAHNDGVALLQIIKQLTYSFEERRFLADALTDVKENFYGFRQGRYMSLQRYHKLFLAQVQELDKVGMSIADEALVNDVVVRNGNVGPDGRAIPDDADRTSSREMSLAIRFIRGANSNYKSYLTHLRNSYLDGNDVYPTTLHEAYNILQQRETDTSNTGVPSNDGVAFATGGEVICFFFRLKSASTVASQDTMHESALMRTDVATDKGMMVVKGAEVLVVDDRVHTS
jgi:hypothetical protein